MKRAILAATLALPFLCPTSLATTEQPMRIVIETISHNLQRYDTVGDYWIAPDGSLHIVVSKMQDSRYDSLVMVHELVEALLCVHRGITMKQIDDFDMGPGKNLDEPGDSPKAPYHKEHVFATKVEKMLAKQLDVNWEAYNKAIDELP